MPDSVELLSSENGAPAECDLDRVEFYVPSYTGGSAALAFAARMPRLRVLQLLTAGYEEAAELVGADVVLCNARGVHDESTAELAVALAVAGRRGFATFASNQARQVWHHERFASLTDSRIAVVGNGSIGRTIIRMLQGFEVEVVAYSKHGREGARQIAELQDDLASLDVVIIAVPLTPETRQLFDADSLAAMRDGALLVNVARGAVIDSGALLRELEAGRLNAALDVTDPEPLPADHPLWRAPNCLLTPHVGGDTAAFEPRGRRLVEAQVERFAAGAPLDNIVAGAAASQRLDVIQRPL